MDECFFSLCIIFIIRKYKIIIKIIYQNIRFKINVKIFSKNKITIRKMRILHYK